MKSTLSFMDKIYRVSDNLEKIAKDLEANILKETLRKRIDDRVFGRKPLSAWGVFTGGLNVAGGAMGGGIMGAGFAMLYAPQHNLTAIISGAVIGSLIIPKKQDFSSSLLADGQRLGADVLKKTHLSAIQCSSKLARSWAESMDPTAAYSDGNGKMIIPPKSRYLEENKLPQMKIVNPQ